MTSTPSNLVEDSLALELIDTNLYRSTKPLWHPPGARGIFGGAVIAQALSAASKTVDPQLQVHSLHSYFVLSGDSSIPVVYTVEILRNGRSFATRTVRALQHGAVIFVLTASFQLPEPSPFGHAAPSPVGRVPPPESLHDPTPEEYAQAVYQQVVNASDRFEKGEKIPPIVARARENGEEFMRNLSEEFAHRPIIFRHVSKDEVAKDPSSLEYRQYAWFKANGTISNVPQTHAIALAYASDHNLLRTSIHGHEGWSSSDFGVIVSLDHIVYFHDEFKADDWLLYESVSPWAGMSRALTVGYIFARDGRHIATCVQEGLLRLADGTKEKSKL